MPTATAASILIARDLGPADIADLRLEEGLVLGIALAEGAATSHAAIMARAFGVPMTVGLGEDVLSIREGETAIVDGDEGAVVVDPSTVSVDGGGTWQNDTADGGHTRVVVANNFAKDGTVDCAQAGSSEAIIRGETLESFNGEEAVYLLRPAQKQ